MLNFSIKKDKNGNKFLETSYRGKALLTFPRLNKSTAFTKEERETLGLKGKLPNRIETLDEQLLRAYSQYQSFEQLQNRNEYLNRLLNNNQTLFYRLVKDHIEEMLPTIYTPYVGDFVQTYNKRFMNPRGLYISYTDQDNIEEILDNRTNPNIELIVVSDGEGVLGIGDQGVGGMAIPIAKLMVYSVFGGVNPDITLPVMLDAGTNNQALLNDPFYLGWRHPRIEGKDYNVFLDKFISALKKKFPHVFLHWEDFGHINAYRNLVAYQEQTCSFNDDIQGTGVVALAALLCAASKTGTPLNQQRIIVFGGGTAGMGVTENIYKGLVNFGLTEDEARAKFWIVDKPGLLTENIGNTSIAQKPFVRPNSDVENWQVNNKNQINLLEVIKNVKPTVLIGTSARTGAFTEEIIVEMARHVDHPIILPLSNPNTRAEATPEDIIRWTEGRAWVATGSPFPAVQYNNKTYPTCQCNNYLAFPGIGLGIISVAAKRTTCSMLQAASQALGAYAAKHCEGLLPTIAQAAEASREIAIAVAKNCIEEKNTDIKLTGTIEELVDENIWEPSYLPYRPE